LILAAVLITAMLLTLIPGCGPKVEEKVIKIAVVGPMKFIQGEHHWAGAEMAAEKINKAGGVKVGEEFYTIKLVKVDTDEIVDPDGAVSAVEKAITSDKVDFLVGGFRTEAVMAYTKMVAEDYQKIFMICGAATNELLEGRVDKDYDTYKYLFRVTPIKSSDLVTVSVLMTAQVAQTIREQLGIMQPKVAVLSENLQWNRVLVNMAPAIMKDKLKLDYVGTWDVSATATDITPELKAIEKAGAHIIYTIISGPLGITYARQWGELGIPAASVGINVEAQKDGFLEATKGYGAYDYTLNTYAPVKITYMTIPFYNDFVKKVGQTPIYTAGTYEAIYLLREAIERAGSLDTDAIIKEMEKTEKVTATGKFKFTATHDVQWGPGWVTGLGVQWQDGKMVATWPFKWKPDPEKAPTLEITYPGVVPYKLPPRVLEFWKQD
jgi:branched-chain amino acid transport system substrate-binding protein